MRVLFVLATVALVFANESEDGVSTESAEAVQQHYDNLHSMVSSDADALNSAMLTEVNTHVALKNPMKTIHETCVKMQAEIRSDRKKAVRKEQADRKMCSTTLNRYRANINRLNKEEGHDLKKAQQHRATWKASDHIPAQKNKTQESLIVVIAGMEVKISKDQKHRNHVHSEFLKLQNAFEMALGNISLIGRVLNGEGTLGDLHGQKRGFLEEQSCSSRLSQIASATSEVPTVSSMLQVFSKSMAKVEAAPAKNVGGATQAKTQKSSGDMDAINTILAKVRENLIKSLTLATKQENAQIQQWKKEKLKQRKNINNKRIDRWNTHKQQGQIEEKNGWNHQKEGSYRIKAAKHHKEADELRILRAFLGVRCGESRRAFVRDMNNKANELNALAKVIRYLKEKVFPKWSKDIVDVVSSPYKWKIENPKYYKVQNTYSTTAHNPDPVSCRTPYATVFSQLRILTQQRTGQAFLDPNDLSHSKNVDWRTRRNAMKGIQCQLFPTGIPVGRANSCSKRSYAKARIDLTGTPFKFGKAALAMFKILGRKTGGSKKHLSSNGKVLTLRVRGRCGDLYGDDAAVDNVDYRSDPIPLENTSAKK